jgi:hypothetical protein
MAYSNHSDNPSDITVTNDFATVETTHDSEELKSAMQNAGVVRVRYLPRRNRPTTRSAPLDMTS